MLRNQETSTTLCQTAQRIATSDVVYSVDTDGSIATQITGAQNDASAITDEDAGKIITDINSFSSWLQQTILFKGLYLQKRSVCTADTRFSVKMH